MTAHKRRRFPLQCGLFLVIALAAPGTGSAAPGFYEVDLKGIARFSVPKGLIPIGEADLRSKAQRIRSAASPRTLGEELLFYARGQDPATRSWSVVLLRRYPRLGMSQAKAQALREAGAEIVENKYPAEFEIAADATVRDGTRFIQLGAFSAYLVEYTAKLSTGHSSKYVRVLVPNGELSLELMIAVTPAGTTFATFAVNQIIGSFRID